MLLRPFRLVARTSGLGWLRPRLRKLSTVLRDTYWVSSWLLRN